MSKGQIGLVEVIEDDDKEDENEKDAEKQKLRELVYETIEEKFQNVLKEKTEFNHLLKEYMEMDELFSGDEKLTLYVKKFTKGFRKDEERAGTSGVGNDDGNEDGTDNNEVDVAEDNEAIEMGIDAKISEKEEAEKIAAAKKKEQVEKLAAAKNKEKAEKLAVAKKKEQAEKLAAAKKKEEDEKITVANKEQAKKLAAIKNKEEAKKLAATKKEQDEKLAATKNKVVFDDGKGTIANIKEMQSLATGVTIQKQIINTFVTVLNYEERIIYGGKDKRRHYFPTDAVLRHLLNKKKDEAKEYVSFENMINNQMNTSESKKKMKDKYWTMKKITITISTKRSLVQWFGEDNKDEEKVKKMVKDAIKKGLQKGKVKEKVVDVEEDAERKRKTKVKGKEKVVDVEEDAERKRKTKVKGKEKVVDFEKETEKNKRINKQKNNNVLKGRETVRQLFKAMRGLSPERKKLTYLYYTKFDMLKVKRILSAFKSWNTSLLKKKEMAELQNDYMRIGEIQDDVGEGEAPNQKEEFYEMENIHNILIEKSEIEEKINENLIKFQDDEKLLQLKQWMKEIFKEPEMPEYLSSSLSESDDDNNDGLQLADENEERYRKEKHLNDKDDVEIVAEVQKDKRNETHYTAECSENKDEQETETSKKDEANNNKEEGMANTKAKNQKIVPGILEDKTKEIDKKIDAQCDRFHEMLSVQMENDVEKMQMKDVELAFFPIIAHSHYYLTVFNLKTGKTMIIDNSESDATYEGKYKDNVEFVRSVFGRHLFMYQNTNADKILTESKKATILKMKWRTRKEKIDCGLYMIMHMELYEGSTAAQWKTG
uniref:Ulp1 protease family, C-terminal catalytic domain-containing protein n=1 Tax=Tanacetum cinerariifolium TaxID=118510 RepID=A0A6L2P019_TANCI|nr:ulp1 protease family, C-terminal catalytic domain-containing protein [Tanacetum cinerariifolium]